MADAKPVDSKRVSDELVGSDLDNCSVSGRQNVAKVFKQDCSFYYHGIHLILYHVLIQSDFVRDIS